MSDAKVDVTKEDNSGSEKGSNFVHDLVEKYVAAPDGDHQVHTRFPPEPNGYLHIGHAKAICIDFGTAEKFAGKCNLRLDDTNPVKEDVEYVDAIKQDVKWLGFDWQDRLFFTSDHYERLYEFAIELVNAGKAYVDSQTPEQIRETRGDFHKPGINSPFRDRSREENLDLLSRMRNGDFPDGAHVLRAKIDMTAGNINLRDPAIYRIKHATHHRTGSQWCIYPMYDFAHCLSDAIEGITHSLCSLEFEDHRPLYDWFVAQVSCPTRPHQYEFARLNLTHTMLSKRKLQGLVEDGIVDGWNDPRMPTLAGLRRRGYSPDVIKKFCDRIGVSKSNSVVEVQLLEHILRDELNTQTPRVMVVQRPLKLVIENYPEDAEEFFEAANHPEYPERGTRKVPFCRELYIEREDFRLDSPKKWFRLSPGKEVRLRGACLITCNNAITDTDTGEVVELRCTWDPKSRGGAAPDGRRVKGTLHWVSARHAIDAEVRLYDRLFSTESPGEIAASDDVAEHLNSESLEILTDSKAEPSLAAAIPGDRFQFERLGYYCIDLKDSTGSRIVFNRTIPLRDSWAKLERALKA